MGTIEAKLRGSSPQFLAHDTLGYWETDQAEPDKSAASDHICRIWQNFKNFDTLGVINDEVIEPEPNNLPRPLLNSLIDKLFNFTGLVTSYVKQYAWLHTIKAEQAANPVI